jgi:hypothetical protein
MGSIVANISAKSIDHTMTTIVSIKLPRLLTNRVAEWKVV